MDQKIPNQQDSEFDSNQLSNNILKAFMQYQSALSNAIANHNLNLNEIPVNPINANDAVSHLVEDMCSHPDAIVAKQFELAKNYMLLWNNVTQRMLGEQVAPLFANEGKDSRFKDEAWEKSPTLDFIKQAYFLNTKWFQELLKETSHLDAKEQQKIEFLTKQLTDALSPSNFGFINPEVIKETLATNGENLIKGAENFAKDLSHSHGSLKISTTDLKAFEVGKNLAITPGKVVYQNDLMQLIQYSPKTEKVFETPILIIAAWINKYYILDLQQQNSFVNWLVEQGHTVFMISWVNPSEKLPEKNFDDYMKDGSLTAIKQVQELTGQKQINVIGYCLGGTLVSATLAYLKATTKPSEYPIKSSTFLASLIDFKNAGDICIFIDEKQIQTLEKRMSEKGYLEGDAMALTFSMIRANDMIWSFFVNNYLLGKDPFPFDILYWNSDSTRLPAKMHSFYLRKMYQENKLMVPNGVTLLGKPIDLRTIDIPTYILSTKEDHIAPWKVTYTATQIYSGDIKFVLSGSGHVAGVVNHPSKNKYNYWVNAKLPENPNEWLENAKSNEGSWWLDWIKWIAANSGQRVNAKKITKSIEDAPGSYVKMRLY